MEEWGYGIANKLSVCTIVTISSVREFLNEEADADLLLAQFDGFARQIPLLYVILGLSAQFVAVSHYGKAPWWLTVLVPGVMTSICVVRGWAWRRRRHEAVSLETARRQIRLTHVLAGVIAGAFVLWGVALARYGDAYDHAAVAFFLALTLMSCLFSLMHVRKAAFLVMAIGGAPFSIYFGFAYGGRFWPEVANLALVACGLLSVILSYSRDFSGLVASRRSLQNERAAAEKLSQDNLRLANLDTLSGLANRRAMLAQLDALGGRDADQGETCLIFIDLDGFKAVNDAFGHKVGDALIVTMASRLNGYLCADAMLARLGGDEFAAAFWGADACLSAEVFARNALETIGRPVVMEGVVTQVGASLGCASADLASLGSTELFRRADVAMYEAKALGGNRIVTYHSDLDASRRRREQLLQEMRQGLQNDEFDLVYQPVVACSDGRVEAVEALIRWPRRPQGGLGPDDFIPVAETTELIHELGLFVLEKAISDIGKHASLRLCVNVSPAQFRDRDFEAQVARIVTGSGFDPARLEFEITEGYLIEQPERARTAIANLKSMGASVALDDYGTGYTSIYYLRNYQFDRIKIDRSLAGRIDVDPQAQTLVTGAVFIANGLDMRITAEGVESEDQVRLLRLAGCHAMQGYHISAPVTREQLSALLEERSQRLSA